MVEQQNNIDTAQMNNVCRRDYGPTQELLQGNTISSQHFRKDLLHFPTVRLKETLGTKTKKTTKW